MSGKMTPSEAERNELIWLKAHASGAGGCIEIASLVEIRYGIRDPEGPSRTYRRPVRCFP